MKQCKKCKKVYDKIVQVRNKRLELAAGDTNSFNFVLAAGLSDALRLFEPELDYLTMSILKEENERLNETTNKKNIFKDCTKEQVISIYFKTFEYMSEMVQESIKITDKAIKNIDKCNNRLEYILKNNT
jgi:hypothetical protein